MTRSRLLLVTDLAYAAAGRRYGDEDVWLADRLRHHVALALCHPEDAADLLPGCDVALVRNSGPVLGHAEPWERFRARAEELGTPVLPQLTGRGDQRGKHYLLALHAAGFPVIPTVQGVAAAATLPASERYVVKPVHGADSIGLRVLAADELGSVTDPHLLVQPYVDLVHEISFYVVDRHYAYALYAPDPAHRWRLERYEPSDDDLAFVRRFVEWNDVDHGIQRVDACRTRDGGLLLVELEDLNPYLSLELLDPDTRDRFVERVVASVRAVVGTGV